MTHWAEKFDWARTPDKHIWLNENTSKYHYSDEASVIDETGYTGFYECQLALEKYCQLL